jgi:hypothetical protein
MYLQSVRLFFPSTATLLATSIGGDLSARQVGRKNREAGRSGDALRLRVTRTLTRGIAGGHNGHRKIMDDRRVVAGREGGKVGIPVRG